MSQLANDIRLTSFRGCDNCYVVLLFYCCFHLMFAFFNKGDNSVNCDIT